MFIQFLGNETELEKKKRKIHFEEFILTLDIQNESFPKRTIHQTHTAIFELQPEPANLIFHPQLMGKSWLFISFTL